MYTLDASVWLREATPIDPAYFLRGGDALYAAVVRRHGCALISLDAGCA